METIPLCFLLNKLHLLSPAQHRFVIVVVVVIIIIIIIIIITT
jgi:hypothetical protein